MPQPSPSIRMLAARLGLSRTTVSDALRGASGVSPATAERVRRAAAEVNYRTNPVESAVMSQMKRGRGKSWFGVIAALDVEEADRPATASSFHRGLFQGARARAQQLGFSVESFAVGREAKTFARMDAIFRARGIDGVLLLPSWHQIDFTTFDWSRYASIYTDYLIRRPALHSLCADHHRGLIEVLERVRAYGWRRPGLFVQRHADERLQHRWTGAFSGYQVTHPAEAGVPPLLFETFDPDGFCSWFRAHQPDVVIGPRAEAIELMTACGARIPKSHGFVCLNLFPYPAGQYAGLDLQPDVMGARAVELLIGHLQRNERGIPAAPVTTMVPARWVDGPTLAPRPRSRAD
jgi:hypothetical protein